MIGQYDVICYRHYINLRHPLIYNFILVSFRPRNSHGAGDGHGDAAADSHVSLSSTEILKNVVAYYTNKNKLLQ